MNRGQKIDEAFRERRAALEEQERGLQAKRELGAARQVLLDQLRGRVLDPVLDEIVGVFARNGSPAEWSANTDADNRSGSERRFSIPGQAAGQSESLVVSAVAALGDPTADSLRVTAQVAERRALSGEFDIRRLQVDGADRETLEASLREWLYETIEDLVAARLARRGM